jgi:hypothetical protein
MIEDMETLYGWTFALVLASPVTVLFVLGLAVVTRSSTKSLSPISRIAVRALVYVSAGAFAMITFATLGLWLWSWRYFESLDDPTATPVPSWIDPTIDLGIGATGISFVLALLAAGLAMTSRLAGALNPTSNDAVS